MLGEAQHFEVLTLFRVEATLLDLVSGFSHCKNGDGLGTVLYKKTVQLSTMLIFGDL